MIIITSLVWFLLDVFLLMYFTDCTMSSAPCERGAGAGGGGGEVGPGGGAGAAGPGGKDHPPVTSRPGFLNRILPNGEYIVLLFPAQKGQVPPA